VVKLVVIGVAMVVRHIPTLMAIGAVLAAYRLLGVGDVFKELIKKDLQPAYDYVIGLFTSAACSLTFL